MTDPSAMQIVAQDYADSMLSKWVINKNLIVAVTVTTYLAMHLHSLPPTSKCLNWLRTVLQEVRHHRPVKVDSVPHQDTAVLARHAPAA